MKRRLTILTFTLALILAGSLAYGAEQEIPAKSVPQTPEISEEDALKAEFLDATEGRENMLPGIDDESSKKIIPVAEDEDDNDPLAKQPKK